MAKRGRLMMYCDTCRSNFVMARDRYKGICPMCGDLITRYRCSRCGHRWTPRTWGGMPRICPSCKSPYWNVERTKKGDYTKGGIADE